MTRLFIIAISLMLWGAPASANTYNLSKTCTVSLTLGGGPKAVFTLERTSDSFEGPCNVVGVEFTFENGKKVDIPKEQLKRLQIANARSIGIKIKALKGEGSWTLSICIKNQEEIPDRIADDRVVFTFEDYKYSSMRLELDKAGNEPKNNAAEQPGAAQPATQPADKTPAKDQPSTPTSEEAPR